MYSHTKRGKPRVEDGICCVGHVNHVDCGSVYKVKFKAKPL